MIQSHSIGVVAVVVTYQPELKILRQLLEALIPQVESVLLVDNGSREDLEIWNNEHQTHAVEVLLLGENMGISAAHNAGIQWARDRRAKYVLLMDQDSIPLPDMVAQLFRAANKLENMGVPLASVGPRYTDERQQNPPPFIQIKGLSLQRRTCNEPDSLVEVDYLISSGCLIPMSVLDKVGGMREDLFIDYVDIEWGLRARHHGFQSYGVCFAHMRHSLGEHPINFYGKNIPLHSPLRHYYHFRNAVYLYKQGWLPLNWKLVDGWRLLLKYVFYSIFAEPRFKHWYMMTVGLWHGLLGRLGKLDGL